MKFSLVAFVAFFALSAHAHTVKPLNSMTNGTAEQARAAGKVLAAIVQKEYKDAHVGGGMEFRAYKIKEVNPPQKSNESDSDLMIRVAKSILHRDFSITGDDGGYSFQLMNGRSARELSNLPFTSLDEKTTKVANDLTAAVRKLAAAKSVSVFYGTGAGNNTMANILVVGDSKNQEFFYVIDSNFGSDD